MVIGSQKEIQEVKNAYDAYLKINDVNPYKLNDLKMIHGIMTKLIIDDACFFRKGLVWSIRREILIRAA